MKRISALACVHIAIGVALSGCQDGSGKEPPEKPPKSGAAPAALPEVALPDDLPALAALVNSKTGSAGSVRVSANTVASTNKGKGTTGLSGVVRDPAGQQPAASFKVVQTGGSDQGTTETVVMSGAVYVKTDGGEYEPGKPWLRITQADLARPGIDVATRKTFGSAFSEAQQGIREASGKQGLTALEHGKLTQRPGWEKIESAETRRYVGSTATATMAAKAADARFQVLSEMGVASIPWTVWVDKRGLIRRFSMTMASGPTTLTTTADYTGWGEPVNVGLPPQNQIATLG